MKRFPGFVILLLPAAVLAAFLPTTVSAQQTDSSQQAVLLRYKFSSRDRLLYRDTTTVKQRQTVANKTFENSIETTEITESRLSRLDKARNFILEREYKKLQVHIQIAQLGEYKFDSTSEENERGSVLGTELTPLYESLKGAVLKVTMTPQGQVIGVRGYRELLGPVLRDKQLAGQFVNGGSNESQQLALSSKFPVFSKKKVQPGDGWEVPFELVLPQFGTVQGKRVYRWDGMETVKGRKLVRITFSTDMTFKLNLVMGGTKVSGTVTLSDSAGTALFDPVRGRLISQTEKYTATGDLTVAANGMNVEIKTSSVQTSRIELLDKLPQ